jgi:hypothetical protein
MTYLAESFSLSVLLETECGEVHSRAEDLRLCQDTDTTDTVNLHLHVWVTVRVAQIRQMRAPRGVLCITFHNDRVLIKSIGERKGSFRLLPGVEIVGLLSTKPVREWSPDV